jgi:hypothetical protein
LSAVVEEKEIQVLIIAVPNSKPTTLESKIPFGRASLENPS